MKNKSELSIVLTFLFICSISIFGQVKKSSNVKKPAQTIKTIDRPVTVYLKDGSPLNGIIKTSNGEDIRIVIAANTLTLKWTDISQIIFTDVSGNEINKQPQIQIDSKSDEAVSNALKSLRKLAAATEVGVSLMEYRRRLIDAKSEVNESLRNIPDGNIKNEINLSMEAYSDAATVWDEMLTLEYVDVKSLRGMWIALKYSVETHDIVGKKFMFRNAILNSIWSAARKHIENGTKSETSSK